MPRRCRTLPARCAPTSSLHSTSTTAKSNATCRSVSALVAEAGTGTVYVSSWSLLPVRFGRADLVISDIPALRGGDVEGAVDGRGRGIRSVADLLRLNDNGACAGEGHRVSPDAGRPRYERVSDGQAGTRSSEGARTAEGWRPDLKSPER